MQAKTDLSHYRKGGYKPGRGFFCMVLWTICSRFFIESGWFPFSKIKRFILICFGAKIEKHVVIKPFVKIKFPWKLRIGSYVWIGEHCWIDNLDTVSIQSHSCLSQRVYLCCGNHNFNSATFDLITQPIEIKQGVWVAASACVMPGTILEEHVVVTAGSIISGHTIPYGIYKGNPAALVKTRSLK